MAKTGFRALHLSGGGNLGRGSWDWLSDNGLLDGGGGSSLSSGGIRGSDLSGGLLGGLLSGLLDLGRLALDGGTELGEGGEGLLLLGLVVAGNGLLLLGQPRERALALLGLGDGRFRSRGSAVSGGSLGWGLSGHGGCQGLGGLDSGDHWGGLSNRLGVLGGDGRSIGLGLLVLGGELGLDGAEDAVALGLGGGGLSWGSLLGGLQK